MDSNLPDDNTVKSSGPPAPRQHVPAEPPPPQIPDHRLLRKIGSGSYGEVWLARNIIGTYRAVKIVYRRTFDSERPFEREFSGIKRFEPISRSHAGMVNILQVGRNDETGYFYYVMEVGDDQYTGQDFHPDSYKPKTLANHLSDHGRIQFEECVRLGISLSAALAHLHRQGLIHRDIKPSNIIFVGGQPKLADIGLVAEMSEARSFVGTEGFIPPEGPGTAQADIYSLGKVLYEISTGKDRHAFPELPSLLGESPEQNQLLELNEVVVKACATDVKERHQTADELHGELVLLQGGRSIQRLRLLERRLARFTRVAIGAGVVILMAAVIWFQISRDRKKEAEIRSRRVGSYVANGSRLVEEGNFLSSLPLFTEALRLDQDDPGRSEIQRVRVASVLQHSPRLAQTWFQTDPVNGLQFSPNGQQLLIASGSRARAWNLSDGQPASPEFKHTGLIESAVFSPDGTRVLTASGDKAQLWDADTGNRLFSLRGLGTVNSASFSSQGDRIVTACDNRVAQVWNATTGDLLLVLDGHSETVFHAAFSPDGRRIVTASMDNTAQIWDSSTGRPEGGPLKHNRWVYDAAFSPDNQRVVTGSYDKRAQIWDAATGRAVGLPFLHLGAVRSVEFSPDGRHVLCAGWDQTTRLWDAAAGKPVPPIFTQSSKVIRAVFSPEGRRLAIGANSGIVQVWDLFVHPETPIQNNSRFVANAGRYLTYSNDTFQVWNAANDQPLAAPVSAGGIIGDIRLSENGTRVITVCTQALSGADIPNLGRLWDAETGRPLFPAFEFDKKFPRGSFSRDGRLMVAYYGNTVQTWNPETGLAISPPIIHEHTVGGAEFNSDATRLVTYCRGQSMVYIWDAATGAAVLPPLSCGHEVSDVEFSPDGRRLVTACSDLSLEEREAQIWDVLTGKKIGPPLPHSDGVLKAAFSPDGKLVVTAGEDYRAIVWDAATGRQITPALKHGDQVHAVAFSADGQWVLTGSDDRTVRVWNAFSGDPVTPPLPHRAKVRFAAFLADGRRVTTREDSGRTLIWDLKPDTHSLSDLVQLSELMCGYRSHESGGLLPQSKEALESSWQALRKATPGRLSPGPEDDALWHRREAEVCEAARLWFAAAFHLDALCRVRPDDAALRARLTAARASWEKQKPDPER